MRRGRWIAANQQDTVTKHATLRTSPYAGWRPALGWPGDAPNISWPPPQLEHGSSMANRSSAETLAAEQMSLSSKAWRMCQISLGLRLVRGRSHRPFLERGRFPAIFHPVEGEPTTTSRSKRSADGGQVRFFIGPLSDRLSPGQISPRLGRAKPRVPVGRTRHESGAIQCECHERGVRKIVFPFVRRRYHCTDQSGYF